MARKLVSMINDKVVWRSLGELAPEERRLKLVLHKLGLPPVSNKGKVIVP